MEVLKNLYKPTNLDLKMMKFIMRFASVLKPSFSQKEANEWFKTSFSKSLIPSSTLFL